MNLTDNLVVQELQITKIRLSAKLSGMTADLVFQNPAEPAALGGSSSETLIHTNRRAERLLHKVFGHLRIPNAQQSISIETVAMVVDPAFWIDSGRSSSRHFGDLIFPVLHPARVAKRSSWSEEIEKRILQSSLTMT
jgi:hypothetical protein